MNSSLFFMFNSVFQVFIRIGLEHLRGFTANFVYRVKLISFAAFGAF